MEELGPRARVGREGEDHAAAYLRAKGYAIRCRNCRQGRDEIDIVAFDPADGVLVFCEVKARRSPAAAFPPSLALTPAKKACMLRAARRYVAAAGWAGGYRIDAILVTQNRIAEHFMQLEAVFCD